MTFSIKKLIQFDTSNMSSFGTLETAELTPVVQLDFVYGINSQTGLATTANSATVDTNASRLRLQSGTNSAGSALFNSRKLARYRAGQGMVARFTAAFATSAASNTQIVGVGNATDGVFIGFNGTSFGIMHRNSGADTWVAQASFNGDVCDGTGASAFNLNKTFGNVYQIKYPYLGYGDIQIYVEDSVTGRMILMHTIRYANTSASVEFTNPNFFFWARSLNAGSVTNCTIYVGSVGMFISGMRNFSSNAKWATDNYKAGVTAETVIFSVRNATTYNGVTNRGLLRLQSFATGGFAASGNAIVVVRLRIGATIGGSPSYACVSGSTADSGVTITSGHSIASVDIAGTTASAGTLIFNISQSVSGQQVIDLTQFELYVAPTEILTVSGFASANSTIAASLTWAEDL